MPDIRELRYFAAVYEDRSVTAAARRCFVSQPSVSAAIAGLEHELGAPLFVRHRKGAVPTPAAAQLYPIARRLVDETRALGSLFRTAPRPRRLVLGLMRALDLERALAIVGPLTQRADLEITLVGADERCDARVIAKSLAAPGETFLPLWEERYVVALPAAHPLALRPRLAPGDLAGAKLIERTHCESAKFSSAAVGMERVASVDTEEWAIALVAAGVGIAIVPEGSLRADPRVVARPLARVTAARRVGLAYASRGPLPPELLALVAAIAPRRRRARREKSSGTDKRRRR